MPRGVARTGRRDVRYRRSPNVVASWRPRFTLEEFVTRRRITASPMAALLLDAFSEPRSAREAAALFPEFSPASVAREIRKLARLGFLVAAEDAGSGKDVSEAWKGSFAAAHFHFATRDQTYVSEPAAIAAYYRGRLAEEPQPPRTKDVRTRTRIPLPPPSSPTIAAGLHETLARRRTVREFSRTSVPRDAFLSIVGGTWGQTGWIDGGILGPQVLKTSPSAGARHPVECYPIVWNVAGIPAGAYHYSVARNALELVRAGDFRREAARIAARQAWVRGAGFLCVLSAVVERTFWKYPDSDAYRLFFLDAGHLGQTFALLATAAGLGPFQTAAISEGRAETLLGLDGIGEFAFYLCGAGMPARRRSTTSPGDAAPRRKTGP